MDIGETFKEGIHRLALVYIDDYKKNGIGSIKNTQVPRQILKMVYNELVSEGLTPIEEITPMEKRMLWEEVGKSDDLKNICIALYTIKKLI